MDRPFLAVGITGGIASGKNLVAGFFEKEGIPVVDADPIGHELIEPGAPFHRPVVELFGPGVVGPDGRIDRGRVAEAVFADPERRRALNALLHPPILEEVERRTHAVHERGAHPIVAVSAALLVEAGAAGRFDSVVLVACHPEVQLRRLRHRDGFTQEEALARLAAQIGDSERRRVAHYVIDNSGSRAATRDQVRRVARALWAEGRRRGLCAGPPPAAGRPGSAAAAREGAAGKRKGAGPVRKRAAARRIHRGSAARGRRAARRRKKR